MTLGRAAVSYANKLLRHANARIDSLTAHKLETARLRGVSEKGQFERPVFEVPEPIRSLDCSRLLAEIDSHSRRWGDFTDARRNDVGYSFTNPYFTSPDAEVLYTIVRTFRPEAIIEVGSGNSTKVARQAILDGGLSTRLVSIDPAPRVDIEGLCDAVRRQPVEWCDPAELASQLGERDILFIDSSHVLSAANDVVFLYLQLLPLLKPGVLVHVHDVFIPYEYPREWIMEEGYAWTEQYLVQALLVFGDRFDAIWAGHYLQRTLPDFATRFPNAAGRRASSLWLRKR